MLTRNRKPRTQDAGGLGIDDGLPCRQSPALEGALAPRRVLWRRPDVEDQDVRGAGLRAAAPLPGAP